MAFGLLGSISCSSSITIIPGGHCRKNKKYVDHSYSRYYVPRSSWNKNGKSLTENRIIKTLENNWTNHYKGIEQKSTFDKYEKRQIINAVTTESYEHEPQAHHNSKIIIESIIHGLDAFRKFSRFYAFMSQVAGSLFSSLLAVDNLSQLYPTFFNGYLQYIVPHFFMHLYLVGLNQLADLEIDKINKPYLPLASGEFSFTNGIIVVASFLFLSFGVAWMIGSKPSLWALLLTFVLMTGYSVNLPFLRWKKSTTLTVMIHSIGMTISFNIAAFMHMKTFVLNKATTYPRSLFFATVVMAIFYAVVAMAKVFWFCVSLLEIAYGAAILIGASSPFLWSKIFSVSTHAIMALILWNRAHSVDLSSNISLQSFYMFIFKLIYLENILTLFVR
ncbi:naringenin 8-dimethylallyltransferase 2, chloroplastic-like [Arachis duranensis]|uniref:Naringenin 8-dimethylallyltransferase 2, chloroplastic-like n=1 Tax=Arachis duranensis TaxID=130453 RepID=A0A9C6T3S3_ARADU|nr:naringenin 8-dimethylallyltransferase 2, chloroplastic-like [Arachis duranensis]